MKVLDSKEGMQTSKKGILGVTVRTGTSRIVSSVPASAPFPKSSPRLAEMHLRVAS
jgi:hypothetical protein